ncbi:MAG: SPFH/Band 7/PHB domain protein [Kiritimatiellae bacterium]|jgi:regulator of protease activity HflC (stomatin/prohibitin superfamily)|nr:SPFH/Band 7/PHB domain protein [Kiritimatiellia bacterium]
MSFIPGILLGLVAIPLFLKIANLFGFFAIVNECEAQVFTLFGKVVGTLQEPGLHIPMFKFGPKALLFPFFGKNYKVDTALRQHYLRKLMVNSEEGTPMGVGIWYEKQVMDPVAYLFTNSNPEASLNANVTSATISVLSNLEMEKMLEDRHSLSRTVRETVSPLSEKWGYRLGSVYIRKVAFTDELMVENITEKVVKRLVQVTSAMKQDGENRVGLIRSETSNKVSTKMAEAKAARPRIVGETLNAIAAEDPEILEAVMDVMETEELLSSNATVEIVPSNGSNVLIQLDAEAASKSMRPSNEPPPIPS